MIKEIKYNGYTTTPSDYECADGDIAAALNVVPDDGNITALRTPETVLKFVTDTEYDEDGNVTTTYCQGYTVVYEHQTTNYTHYIILDTTTRTFYWLDSEGNSSSGVITIDEMLNITPSTLEGKELGLTYNSTDTLNDINAIGNTLMILTEEHIYYFLWTNGAYKYLGDHIPTLNISFGLRGKPRLWSLSKESEDDDDERGTFTVSGFSIDEDEIFNEWTEENKSTITNAVMAKVNKFLAEQSVNSGRFCLPFFVRYALRLYDGSLTHHSAPILMNPSTKAAPIVFWKRISGKGSYTDAECDIMLVSASLDYRVIVDSIDTAYADLKNDWSDIVKSVDIFISKPIYTYDQSEYCTSFADTDNYETAFIGALDFDTFTYSASTATNEGPKNDEPMLPLIVPDHLYDDEGTASTLYDESTDNANCIKALTSLYIEWKYSTLYALYFSADRTYPSTTIKLPEFSDEKNREKLQDISSFYFLESIDIKDLSTTRTGIEIDDDYMQSLSSREVMDDDYLSNDRLMADHAHVYNSRLNLSGVKRALFKGFPLNSMLAYNNHNGIGTNASTTVTIQVPIVSGSSTTKDETLTVLSFTENTSYIDGTATVSVYIKENGETYCVTSTLSDEDNYLGLLLSRGSETRSWPSYFFYPNTNAYKIVATVAKTVYTASTMVLDLTSHDFLNGAYATIDYNTVRSSSSETLPTVTNDTNIVEVPSKLYTSDTNNPFRFDVSNINTIGTGRILGIATAAKALSEGQFGEFPLYAFTTEGVWAMTVSQTTGAYSAVQPFTRDVLIKDSDGDYNADCITQIDSAVLFASDRGVMLVSGSNSTCISDILNGRETFDYTSLPGASTLITEAGFTTDQLTYASFLTFLKDCGMLYDYTHQRIIVYNPSYSYAYIYSMKDKAWSMMASAIQSSVNSYPEALAMLSDGSLVNLCTDDTDDDGATTALNGLLFTRPFKFGDPTVLKTVDTIIQRGHFVKDHVQQVLYGSRDLINWHLIWSSKDKYLRGFHGTPYKFFRLAISCQLDSAETLHGFTAQFTPRLTNKPR